jgi:hypothetical protein
MGRFKYEPSLGAAQYRRTLYTFWRRSIAPTFLFDTAQRRVCEVRNNRTNTPLQALTLLNDEGCREASRVLAMRAVTACAQKDSRLDYLSEAILGRTLKTDQTPFVQRSLESALTHYNGHREDAQRFLQTGQAILPTEQQQPEVAAYALVASLLFNLDEAITHE